MDPFIASVLAGFAGELAAGVVLEVGKSLRARLAPPEQARALQQAIHYGLLAMVMPARDLSAEDGKRFWEAIQRFFKRPETVEAVGALLGGRELPAGLAHDLAQEVDWLEERLGASTEACLRSFEAAFWLAAEGQPELQGRIIVGELRQQKGIQRKQVELLGEILAILKESKGSLDIGSLGVNAGSITATNVAGQQTIIYQFGPSPADRHRPDGHLLGRYLERLFVDLARVDMLSVDRALAANPEERPVGLPEVYTALLTTASADREGRGGRGKRGRAVDARAMAEAMALGDGPGHARRASALNEANDHRHLVLLGDPGSGKSTFVKNLALALAGERLGEERANLKTLTRLLPWEEKAAKEASAEAGGRQGRGEAEPPTPQRWEQGALLPVLVILRDFAASEQFPRQPKDCKADALWSFIRLSLEQQVLGDVAEELRKELLDEGGLVILDGLDEVPEADARRERLKAVIGEFARTFGRCRILVTSRTYAYQNQDWKLPGYTERLLEDFIPEQVDCFIEAWYRTIGPLRNLSEAVTTGRALSLSQAIRQRERLAELAGRPLLLTLMASLHAHRGQLPDRRQALYEDAVDLLLDRWELGRVVKNAQSEVIEPSVSEFLGVDKEAIRKMLNELAFQAHAGQVDLEGTADIPEGDLLKALRRLSDEKGKSPNILVLLDFLRYRAGILTERGNGVFTFPHRTFQEYLAACYLADKHLRDKLPELATTEPERWREALLLAGAKVASGSEDSFWQLARKLCPTDRVAVEGSPTDAQRWGAQLAGEMLAESTLLKAVQEENRDIVNRVAHWLSDDLLSSSFPATERATAGRSLARLGDPRPEVLHTAKMAFCWVPPGEFWMGSDKGDELAWDDEQVNGKAHRVAMREGFWMGQYPVTQAQFAEFVAAGGYGRAKYWAVAKAAGRWADGVFIDRPEVTDSAQRTGPREFSSPFDAANHPVVGITWYEALAYSVWATEQYQDLLPKGWRLTLASEAEWEKAARGGLLAVESPVIRHIDEGLTPTPDPRTRKQSEAEAKRRYPWGNDPDPDRANYADTKVGSTSAVGCFPGGTSVYGCQDMSGNVWEWTRSAWEEKYPYPPPGAKRDEREGFTDAARPRVLRGGAFNDLRLSVRCAYRIDGNPSGRSGSVGFRLVGSPFDSGR